MLASVRKRSQIPRTLNRFYYRRIFRTAAVQGLGRINSEAIKFLTPLLPIRPLVEYFIGKPNVLLSYDSLSAMSRYYSITFSHIVKNVKWFRGTFSRRITCCVLILWPFAAFHFPTAIWILLLVLSCNNAFCRFGSYCLSDAQAT